MMERDASKRLSGRVELDDAYLGGERSGGKRGGVLGIGGQGYCGRGAESRTLSTHGEPRRGRVSSERERYEGSRTTCHIYRLNNGGAADLTA